MLLIELLSVSMWWQLFVRNWLLLHAVLGMLDQWLWGNLLRLSVR